MPKAKHNTHKKGERNAKKKPKSQIDHSGSKLEILSSIVSLILLVVVFAVTFGFAFYYWTENKFVPAIWWALGTWIVAGVGIAVHHLPEAVAHDSATQGEAGYKDVKPEFPDRAWVSMNGLSIEPAVPTAGRPLTVVANAKNTGRSPARNVRGHFVFERVFDQQAPNFDYTGLPLVALDTMTADTPYTAKWVISTDSLGKPAPLIQPLVDALATGKQKVFAHGRLDYEDARGNPHWTEWCLYLATDFRSWIVYPRHNGDDTNPSKQ